MTVNPDKACALAINIEENVSRVIVGKNKTIRLLLIALTAGGHVLIEDVPGIGKTTLVTALARSLDLDFARIQFTPDVMPSDVTGYNIFDPKTGDFSFKPGAIMTQILLADEINRTSPKTQSALLEAMQENQVTVDQTTYALPQPFMVMATQNPIEQQGTYVLPEAQLDRFMFRMTLGYPTAQEEINIMSRFSLENPIDSLEAVASAADVLWLRDQARQVYVADAVKAYITKLAQQTRSHPDVELGASPRASLMLMQASKAAALLSARDYVIPDDVQSLLHYVFDHRLLIKAEGRLRGAQASSIVESLKETVQVPTQK
ncbi:MAG: MoxR family ATPase [Eubacteriales bacterium]|nr:MoxR family ATPase [Eubacteriales bacterium]MDD4323988.1 MoxR family ATPase [Eubacteriales bacterium]MDD4541522.1 MoxR family ATPase [Eubacteriales bacterium]